MNPTRFLRIGFVLSAAVSVLYFLLSTASPGHVDFDDAYMFVRYGKHFLSGAGFSWNIGEGPSYGATSALYLMAVTIARGLTSASDTNVLFLLSMAAGLLACATLVALGFLVLPDGVLRRSWVPILIVPILALSQNFRYHSGTGMETTLSLLCNALLAVTVVAFTRRQSGGRLSLCLLAGYLSFLARPDNGLVDLLFPPLFFVASDRRLRKSAALYTVLLGILLVTDAWLKSRLFGDAIPLAFFAKRSGFYSGYVGAWRWNAAGYVLAFMAECLPWFVVTISLWDAGLSSKIVAAVLPTALTFTYYFGVTQIMGFGARYYVPFLPFAVLAAFIAMGGSRPNECASDRLFRLRGTWIPRAALIIFVLVITAETPRELEARGWRAYVVGQPSAAVPAQRYVTPDKRPLPFRLSWDVIIDVTALLKEVPSDTVVAASEYGYLGSELPNLTIIDVLGLHDRQTAHNGFDVERLLSRNPDLIWLPHPDYTALIKSLLDSPTFRDGYDYYPGAFEYGLAINKHSPRIASIMPAAARAFARVYEGRRLADYRALPAPDVGIQ